MAKNWKVLDETEKSNFYQSWIPYKEPLCRNLQADKERTLIFLY